MPRSTWFKALLLLVALWAPLSQAETGWQPIQETIRKSDKDNRQYQAIRLDNGMVVLLVSDPQAVKSLSALVVPVGSLEDPEAYQGLAHYLEHMSLMGSKKYPQADSLAEYLKMHGGSHNASTAPYRTAFYLEVENDALPGAVDRLADAIAEPLLDKKYAERERNAVNAELTMARTRDGMRMAQVSAETINPAHPGSKFSGGNLETLSDKPGNPVQQALKDFHEKYYSANLMKAVIYSNKPLPELAKMAVIIAVSFILSKKQDEYGANPKAFKYIMILTGLVFLLIAPENLSTAMLLFGVVCMMMFIGRKCKKI